MRKEGNSMKKDRINTMVDGTKVAVITVLSVISILIILLGVAIIVYSFINDIIFTVMSSDIHGAIWGLVIAFLGVRYFLSVQKLKIEVYKNTSKFSWNNFKSDKGQKNNLTKTESKKVMI